MPLKITYKSPPYRDKVLEFIDTLEEVRVGRTEGSEVPFPESMSAVGHDHFAIKREAGGYRFVIDPQHRVYADGKDVLDGQALSRATEVRLGTPGGPRLLLEPSRAHGSQYVATEPQGHSATLPDVARAAARWTHVLGAVIALGLLFGLFAWWRLSGAGDQPLYTAGAATADFSGIIAKYQDSVFLVDEVDAAGNSHGGATAFVIALKDGSKAFATNAHVAAMLAEAKKGGFRLVVRAPGADHREYEIKRVLVHPAYAAFNAVLAEAEHKANNGMLRQVDLSPAYDVAILIPAVQDGLPAPLPLAPSKALETLRAGQPIAFIGYPAENLVAFDTRAPAPTAQTGIITSLRNFFLTADGGPAQLIEHSLPSAGGASGSPIFNAHGQVIALLSGGNNIASKEAGRIPNAAMVNFAQRADLLSGLIEGTADAELGADRDAWMQGIARWSRAPSAVATVYAKAFEDAEGALGHDTRGGATAGADPLFGRRSAQAFDFTLAPDRRYLVTAYTDGKAPLRIVVYNAEDPAALIDTTVDVADGPLSVVEIPSGPEAKVRIAVISEAGGKTPDLTPVPFKLDVYWPKGKPPAGNGQESGASPHGGSGAKPVHAPDTPAAPSGGESGGDEGQGGNH